MKDKMFINCKTCNKEIRIYPSNLNGQTKKVYCSKICQNIDYKSRFNGKNNPNYTHGPKNCIDCGKLITRNAKERCLSCKSKYFSGENNPFFGKSHSDNAKKIISKNRKDKTSTFKGKHHSEESKKKLSESKKREWENATDEHKQKYLDGLQKACLNQMLYNQTIPEKLMEEILKQQDIEYEINKPLYNKFLVDFFITGTNIIIEVFGDYWHGNKSKFPNPNTNQIKQMNKDKSRLSYLRKCGHKVIVIWESNLISEDSRISSLSKKIRFRQKGKKW